MRILPETDSVSLKLPSEVQTILSGCVDGLLKMMKMMVACDSCLSVCVFKVCPGSDLAAPSKNKQLTGVLLIY